MPYTNQTKHSQTFTQQTKNTSQTPQSLSAGLAMGVLGLTYSGDLSGVPVAGFSNQTKHSQTYTNQTKNNA